MTLAPPGLLLPSPLEEVHDDRLAAAGVHLWLKRDDLIHPELPGNKWRKLIAGLRQELARDLRDDPQRRVRTRHPAPG